MCATYAISFRAIQKRGATTVDHGDVSGIYLQESISHPSKRAMFETEEA
jgi:hypothetical protein